jgi:hypothetical protein
LPWRWARSRRASKRAHEQHVAEPVDQLVGGQIGHPLPHGVAVVVEHPHQLLAHQRDALDLLVERRPASHPPG